MCVNVFTVHCILKQGRCLLSVSMMIRAAKGLIFDADPSSFKDVALAAGQPRQLLASYRARGQVV